MHKLVLIRHGESTWNLENRFTGWTDVPLTDTGVEQARQAGRLLKEAGYEFDLAYTSVLKRAIWTLGMMQEKEVGPGIIASAELIRGDTGAVVDHAELRLAAAVVDDDHLARAGVERVLDQLLYDGRRTLDDFAGGDACDDRVLEGENRLSRGQDPTVSTSGARRRSPRGLRIRACRRTRA